MALPDTLWQGGQMTDLPLWAGVVFDGTELLELVAPGDPSQALNYRITTEQLALFLAGLVATPIIVTTGATVGNPYEVPLIASRILFKKVTGSPTYVFFDASQLYPFPVLIRDLKGDADVNPITVTFSGGQLCDGLSTVTINTPYGGYYFNPLAAGGFYLGTS